MSLKLEYKVEGLEKLGRALELFSARVQGTVMRKAVRAGGSIVEKAATRAAAKRSGLLRRSLGMKVKTYRAKATPQLLAAIPHFKPSQHAGTTLAIVGPRPKVDEVVVTRGRVRIARPVRYAHLVEKGHQIARRGISAKDTYALRKTIRQETKAANAAGLVLRFQRDPKTGREIARYYLSPEQSAIEKARYRLHARWAGEALARRMVGRVAARPFLLPALEGSKQAVFQTIASVAKQELARGGATVGSD